MALFSQNMPNWVIAYFAVVSKGLIIVPILPDFTREEAENVLLHSESKILFVSEKQSAKIEGLNLPDIKAQILLDNFSVRKGAVETSISITEINKVAVLEEDIATIIYTSGTTGRSKGVVLTHKNVAFVAMQSYTF